MALPKANRDFFDHFKAPLTWTPRRTNVRPRILVVDDDLEICQLNIEILTFAGYQVDAVNDGLTAWNSLLSNPYDLVISDNKMEGFTGVELIKMLKANHISVKVLLLTGNLPDADVAKYLTETTIMLKPYAFDILLDTVKGLLV